MLVDGIGIRLTREDIERGRFSQRKRGGVLCRGG